MFKRAPYYYALLALIILNLLAGAVIYAQWQEPPLPPPGGNTPPPLNVSATSQTKQGPLTLGQYLITGGGITANTGGATTSLILRPIFSGAVLTGATFIEKSGNVGIGTINPGAKLEVIGQIKITGGSPAENKILASDKDGLASWKAASDLIPAGGGDLPPGTNGQTLRHDGAKWVANSFLQIMFDGDVIVPQPGVLYIGGEARGTWPNFITYTCEEHTWTKNPKKGFCFDKRGTYSNSVIPLGATCWPGDNRCADPNGYASYKNPPDCPAGYIPYESSCHGDCGGDSEATTVCRRI